MISREFIEHLSKLSGTGSESFRHHTAVGGGSINNCFHLQYREKSFFLKVNDAEKFPGMFDAERSGLDLLRRHCTLHIPEVIATGIYNKQTFILMNYIRPGIKTADFFESLGIGLADLHSAKSDKAGLDHSNYIGSLTQLNDYKKDCIKFFIELRLLPMMKLAKENRLLPAETERGLLMLIDKLPAMLPIEKPSLLHGDLWSGNYMSDSAGKPCLIDPAVYFGHREADIAMTKLFGGFDDVFYIAYNDALPLFPKWEERIDLWNLYPLLVHLNLFGRAYLNDIRLTVEKYN